MPNDLAGLGLATLEPEDRTMSAAADIDRFRQWLAKTKLPQDGRLPPERSLAGRLGLSRSQLRKILAKLEAEGRVWRHVGRGTFINKQSVPPAKPDIGGIAEKTNPPQAMQARMIIEPEVARLAALHATSFQINEMRELARKMRQAKTWAEYEDIDWRFHNLLAESSGNTLLQEIQYLLNGVRRAVVWGHLNKAPIGPPENYHSFAEHDDLIDNIAARNRSGAAAAMQRHLGSTSAALMEDDEP
ncbi:FadR/GntR family transcriptional regulator [Bradyrhizobium sp.]|uniref:FadR/GntR family transcriptional regulator n=1 Tax=Bradyrhizobium sp. TaxID=376 RepID=UPI003C464E4D